ncbi:MAG: hypothetical protein QOJ89_1965 [bacterium]|jgi:hypothetical protein
MTTSNSKRRKTGRTQAEPYVPVPPECQRSICVDSIINDPPGGHGFGVLTGGGSTSSAQQFSRTVAESVVPTER